jgi:hypothetical protein
MSSDAPLEDFGSSVIVEPPVGVYSEHKLVREL